MIKYYQKVGNTIKEVDESQSQWINVCAPLDNSELEYLADQEGLPLDFLMDSLDLDERSRFEKEDDVRLIVINTPLLNEDEKESDAIYITAPIGIILTDKRILTISAVDDPILSKFIKNRIKNFDPMDRQLFALQIFEQTVYQYLDCLKKLSLKRNLIEQELYNSSRNRELQQLLRIEKSLVYIVNSLSDNDLLKQKIRRTDYLGIRELEAHQDLFEDIIIDNNQALEMAKVHTNILGSTLEAYASIISNNLNLVIHRLTLITIILMVPTLVASFYGMNLKYIPFQNSAFAFYLIIIFSVVLGFLLILFFKRGGRV